MIVECFFASYWFKYTNYDQSYLKLKNTSRVTKEIYNKNYLLNTFKDDYTSHEDSNPYIFILTPKDFIVIV